MNDSVDFAYVAIEGCVEVESSEVEDYIDSVERDLFPEIDEVLYAKEQGAQQTFSKLLY